jgi:protein-tyrosine phosphatase
VGDLSRPRLPARYVRGVSRNLDWPNCLNARDLGGLATRDGGETRRGAVVRSDNPAFLNPDGWVALHDYGVRTIVALRTLGAPDEEPDEEHMPRDIGVIRVVLEDLSDPEFVDRLVDTDLWATPLCVGPMLERWPGRCAAAVAAVARAGPGGVVISCGRGCDRTGLAAFLLLALAGVGPREIAEDWELSVERVRPRDPTYGPEMERVLRREGTSVLGAIERTIGSIDIAARLLEGGLQAEDLDAVRRRLGPSD